MKKRIALICPDKYLGRKIRLILSPPNEITDIPSGGALPSGGFDLVLCPVSEAARLTESYARLVTFGDGGDIPLPFSEEILLSAVSGDGESTAAPPLVSGEKCAYLYGKALQLTEVEFALFSELYSAQGGFVSREELVKKIWGDGASDGVLNVYVHYLREKLEFRGEKIIISSRKQGYKIDEKYLISGGCKDA